MKSRFLFPNQLRPIGWLLAIPGFALGYFALYRDYKIPGFSFSVWPSPFFHNPVSQDLTKTLALALIIIGLFFIAFSKEKKEDELTVRMRQNALYWSVLISYIIYLAWLIAAITFELLKMDKDPLGGLADILGMSIYNLFTPLLLFMARYYYLRYRQKDEYRIGKLYYLPSRPFKFVGMLISIPLLMVVLVLFIGAWFTNRSIDISGTGIDVMLLFLPLSLLMWGYSKQKDEDEYTAHLRLESMQVAIYANYAILLLANIFFYFLDFMVVMFLNLGAIAFFFVLRFSYVLWKNKHDKHMKGILAL